ncbi:MAG: hypothetical protein RMJ13_04625 [Elusimicrobiota bacterium]|nr:hypothetical protein [Elusimicrobiota bacterium]
MMFLKCKISKHTIYKVLILAVCNIYLFALKTEVFNYKIYPTDNFDIYYVEDSLVTLLPQIEQMLDEIFVDNTEYFDVKFDYKIPFFLFYGYQEFLQNTIVPVGEETGGVTEAFKNRFLVPYTGSMKFLQHVVSHEFIHEIEFNILYSGFWRTPLLLKSIFYPYWLLEGLAEYRSSLFVKTQQEMMVRDMAVSNKLIPLEHLHSFSHLKPHMILPAYEQSAKLIEFIVKEYGDDRVVKMLKIYRNKFDVNSVLYSTIGINLKELQNKFFEEMHTKYNYEIKINSMTDLPVEKKITKDGVYPVFNYLPITFQHKLVYLSDIDGKLMFYYLDEKGRNKLLIPKRALENIVDTIQTDKTRISVSDNGILCFAGLKDNRSFIYLYNISSKELQKISTQEIVDLLTSVFISHDGETVYLAGVKNCSNVLYGYKIDSKEFFKIKQDENFISEIAVSKDGKKLVYVKEQLCKKNGINTWQNDVFILDLENNVETQITSTLCDENYPYFTNEDTIIFISDYSKDYEKKFYGVNNLFVLNLKNNSEAIQLTNVIGGVTYVFANSKDIYLTYYRGFNQHIYRYSMYELIKDDLTFTSYKIIPKENEDFTITQPVYKEKYGATYPRRDIKPYKFFFSTDLFIPVIYFSSYEGLLMLLYWQGSDMVGENNLGLSSIVIGDRNYNITLQYAFTRYRPIFIFETTAESSYNQYTELLTRKLNFSLGISYPIDRLSYLSALMSYIKQDEEIKFDEITIKDDSRENIFGLSYTRNSLIGKFIEPNKGSYFTVGGQLSDRIIDGNFSYTVWQCYYLEYFDLSKEYSLFTRLHLLSSAGRDKISFYLGGPERVSGIWYDDVVSSQISMFRIGWRFPIVYDINYYTWYLFPDFFFKNFFGELFVDTGMDENIQTYSSLGLRFKLYSFILQRYVMRFELIFAKQFDINKPTLVYFNLLGGI